MQIDLASTPITDANGRPMATVYVLTPRIVISGDLYPSELRELARQLVTIANDAEQGMRGEAVYSIRE